MNILIAGGSGLIGRHLSQKLFQEGYSVSILSRKPEKVAAFNSYYWDPGKQVIDLNCFKKIHVIINLAGAGIGDKLWFRKRKRILYNSRIDSTKLLINSIKQLKIIPDLFIQTSAIGYYGNRPGEKLDESSSPGNDFLARLCVAWENESKEISSAGIPLAIIRTGIVLSNKGGFLSKSEIPIRLGLNVFFGNGLQPLNWIHINDLTNILMNLITRKLKPDTYNAVSPNPVAQLEFNNYLLNLRSKKNIRISIPHYLLKTLPGGMDRIFFVHQLVVPIRLQNEGFLFKYSDYRKALIELQD